MVTHLPILQVVVPLLAAPSCLILRRSGAAWLFALVASAVTFAISIALLSQVMSSGSISYELGGWNPPWGIEYRIDALAALLLLLISGMSTIVLIAARTSILKEIPEEKHMFFFVLFLLSMAGMLGMVATGDAFNVFVFMEISALSAYALISMGKGRRSLWASFQYLIMGTIGATFILIGIGMMYQMTGTLNMEDLAKRLPEVAQTKTVFVAFAFFVVGVCLKMALFPLHLWLPNAYAYAPSVVSAFFAATSTKVAVYLLIRFTFSIFGYSFSFSVIPLTPIFITLGITGVFVASVAAIYQKNLKHLFAYSSVAQIGYIIIGFGLGTTAGLSASVLHVFNHALMKGALFLALAAVVYQVGSTQLNSIKGLGRQMPLTAAAIVASGLSLIGVPLTAGFISKWYLALAVIEQGWWPIVVLILLGSLLAAIYVWRFVEAAYFMEPEPGSEPVGEAPWVILGPAWLLVGANIFFGVDTRLSVQVSQFAAQSLFGVSP